MMKKFFTSVAACVLALGTALAGVGDVADFSGLDNAKFYRNPVKAEDLQGKVVVLEYWGIMCHPCRRSMPELQAFYEEYQDRGLMVIISHCQNAPDSDIQKFMDEQGITFPSCSRFYLRQATMPRLLPLTILIGADGRVLAEGKPWEIIPQAKELLEKK